MEIYEKINTSKPHYYNHPDRMQARFATLQHALNNVTIHSYVEFGVDTGTTINFIANWLSKLQTARYIVGFDSFYGLPENWTLGHPKGTFNRNGVMPEVAGNVLLIKGLFEETLPLFIKPHDFQWGFIHIDCDIYSSTKAIFDNIGKNIAPGTIIAFDELINYDQYILHELKAFEEFLHKSGLGYEILCYNQYEQVVVKITAE